MTIINKTPIEPASTESPSEKRVDDPNGKDPKTTSGGQLPSLSSTPPIAINNDPSAGSKGKEQALSAAAPVPVLGKRITLIGKRKFSASDVPDRPASSLLGDLTESLVHSKRLRQLELSYRSLYPAEEAQEPGTKQQKASASLQIHIKPMMGTPFTVSILDDSYVFELKDMIAERTGLTLGGVVLSLTTSGRMLANDEQLLTEAGITSGTTLNLTVKVSSGLEPALCECDLDCDSAGEEVYEFYEVDYDDAENAETIAELTKLIEEDRATNDATPVQALELGGPVAHQPVPVSPAAISRILDAVPRGGAAPSLALDGLEGLKLSGEDEDRLHDQIMSEVFGPRGASIFKSPVLEPAVPSVTSSSQLTGASHCHCCGIKCKLAQRFQCKCGHTFCPSHRYYDQHSCTYDFRAKDLAAVERANPKVVKAKLEKL